LSVERLEDRTVPDVTGNFPVPLNTATAAFSPGTNGVFVPLLTATPAFPNGASNLGNFSQFPPILSISAVDSLGQFNQLSQTDGANAVDSSGESNPLALVWTPNAWGFGSGTQPGQPWAPAYMTVGLANQPSSLPWGNATVAYGPGLTVGPGQGNQAAPPPGPGGAGNPPGDLKKPDQGDQGNPRQKDKDHGQKGQQEEGPRKLEENDQGRNDEGQREKGRQEERQQSGEQEDQRPNDQTKGVRDPARDLEGQAVPSRPEAALGASDAAFADPAVLWGTYLISPVDADTLSGLLLAPQGQPAADDGFTGASVAAGIVDGNGEG
jgi:hypothetical protein